MIFALLLQIILICVNAVFAGAEIAVVSMNGATLQARAEEGNRKAKVLMRLGGKSITLSGNHSGGHHAGRIFRQCLCDR